MTRPSRCIGVDEAGSVLFKKMCGRFSLTRPSETVQDLFGYSPPSDADTDVLECIWRPRFNIAPTQPVLIARVLPGLDGIQLGRVRWGLVPGWAKDTRQGARLINARSETAASKPAFRGPFKKHRCLIPADGFFEWKRSGKSKQPYYVRMNEHAPFALAGLWARWESPGGEVIESCTILTTVPNDVVAHIHDRMPVILAQPQFELWLDPEISDPQQLTSLLVPFPPDQMEAFPVSDHVGKVGNDDRYCIEPAAQGELKL